MSMKFAVNQQTMQKGHSPGPVQNIVSTFRRLPCIIRLYVVQ